ncbi:MAG: ankyrin repeat domain-containing protein, partial [Gemmatimonadetes bacterium]|nr:ankyrin repeat domain-containing protein [Gemmatimonadota bacterium]
PLHLASRAGSAPVIKMLLDAGADVKAVTSTSSATALHFAAAAGDAAAVALLIDRGADINARESEWQQTPLIFAAAGNRSVAIKVLLERGADANLTTKVMEFAKENAVNQAANRRRTEVLAAFGAGGPQVAADPDDPRPPSDAPTNVTPSQVRAAALAMREVYSSGKVQPGDAAPQGRGGGGGPSVTAMGGLTALHHAARQGYLDAVVALVDGGADVDQVSGSDGTSPLLMAALNGQFDVAMVLIERGADPDVASTLNGAAPLWATINSYWQPRTRFPQPREHEAQKATYLDVMEALMKAGANPDHRMTAHPWYMVYGGCGNANCGLEEVQGSTAFWRAAYGLDIDAMKLLAKYGADINLPTYKPADRRNIFDPTGAAQDPSGLPQIPVGGPGVYAIHAVTGVGYGEGFAGNAHRFVPGNWMAAAKYAIEELGMDPNQPDFNGYRPLHHAASRGDNEMILYLVSKGADVTVVSRRGQTVADMANGPYQRTSPYPLTVKLLEALGSKNNHKCVTC